MGDVGDHGNVELGRGDPVLGQPLGGGLQERDLDPGLGHLGQVSLHLIGGGGGGVKAGVHFAPANLGADGVHGAHPVPGGGQDAPDQAQRGGLAVGAGDADYPHPASGVAVDGGL